MSINYKQCPRCGSRNVLKILYGMPTQEAFQKAEAGEIKLGGCCIIVGGPEYSCGDCEHEWNNYSFLKFDTKRLLVMLLKTNSGPLIKSLLSKLFAANRDGTWNVYDTSLAINYLVQRDFKHHDLLEILRREEPFVYQYYELFCKQSFLKSIGKSEQAYIMSFGKKGFSETDDKLFFLYFMYMDELKKNNHLSAFAYYKNFFDRISAQLGKAINNDCEKVNPTTKLTTQRRHSKNFTREFRM